MEVSTSPSREDALQDAAKAALERKRPEKEGLSPVHRSTETHTTASDDDMFAVSIDSVVKRYPEDQQKIVNLWLHSRDMLAAQTRLSLAKTGYAAISKLISIFYRSSDRLLWEVCDLNSDEVRTSYESLILTAYSNINELVEKSTSKSGGNTKVYSLDTDNAIYESHYRNAQSRHHVLFSVSEQLEQRACTDGRMLTASITRYMTTHFSKIIALSSGAAATDERTAQEELFVLRLLLNVFRELIDQPNIDERLINETTIMNTKMAALSKRGSASNFPPPASAQQQKLKVPSSTTIGGGGAATEKGAIEKTTRCGPSASSLYSSERGGSTATAAEKDSAGGSFSNCLVM